MSFVQNAVASQGWSSLGGGDDDAIPLDPEDERALELGERVPETELESGIVKVLRTGGFGEGFCEAAAAVFRRHNAKPFGAFAEPDCAAQYDREFGIHLADNVDFPEVFRDYEYRVQRVRGGSLFPAVVADRCAGPGAEKTRKSARLGFRTKVIQ